jgi:hypothetical protein
MAVFLGQVEDGYDWYSEDVHLKELGYLHDASESFAVCYAPISTGSCRGFNLTNISSDRWLRYRTTLGVAGSFSIALSMQIKPCRRAL